MKSVAMLLATVGVFALTAPASAATPSLDVIGATSPVKSLEMKFAQRPERSDANLRPERSDANLKPKKKKKGKKAKKKKGKKGA